jgi:tRNA(Ile2) C34 agmatinyltransferase TiaS
MVERNKNTGERGDMPEFKTLKISAESWKVLEQIRTLELYRAVMLKDLIHVAWPKCPSCGAPLVRKIDGGVYCVGCKKEYTLQSTTS